jgi:carbon monoxide dehydrogenase subunit G
MVSVERTFTTRASRAAVFSFLADFAHAEQWDPGTVECIRIDGDGGVGSRYRNVSSFLGRTTEVEYVTEEVDEPQYLHFHGHNDQFEGHDRLRLDPDGAGTRVTYRASLEFAGAARFVTPLVAAYLPFLARRTIRQLRERLDALE